MRTLTIDQRVAWQAPGSVAHVQVRIVDKDGFTRNWTDLFGRNFVESVDWGETQDQPGQDATITLVWRQYQDNASPWVVAGQRLAGYLGVGQRVLIDTAILPEGIDPQSGDWVTVFDGQIDSFSLDYPTGTIQCRDRIIAQLTDRWVETDTAYGSVAGSEMEAVMASIIADWGGSPTPTLWTPTSPGFAVTRYNQQAEPVLAALNALALLTGWDLRPRWRESAAAYQLALTEPDRVDATSAFYLYLSQIHALTGVGVAIDDIRNVVRVFYSDGALTTGGQLALKSVVRTNADSVTKYGRRFFDLTEGSSSAINTLGEATALANAILADLSEPDITATVTIPLEWWLELGDVITIEADGERFGASQVLAIVGIRRHVLGGEAYTTLQLYGKPRTGRRNWLEREARAGVAPAVSQIKPLPPLPPHGEIVIGGVGIKAKWPITSGFDSLEFHRGLTEDFTPSEATLVQLGRERAHVVVTDPGVLAWYKTVVTDRYGNRSDPSEAAAGIAGYVPAPALAPAVRAVVQVQRITSDQAISSSGLQTVQLQQEDFDPAAVWSAGSYWLVPLATGIYRLDLDMWMEFDSATTYAVSFVLDGGSAVWTSGTRAAVTERYQVSTLIALTSNEKYLLQLERDTGTAIIGVGSKMIIEPTLAVDADTPPTLTTSPAITGTSTVGEVLSCSSGTWTSSPTATYEYQWMRDAVAIAGATSATHTLVEDDEGALISCRIIATNRAGVATAIAPPVGPIAPVAPSAVAYLLEDGTSALLLETGDQLIVEAGAASKISALTAAGTLTGAEILAVVQGGTTLGLTLALLAAWAVDQIAPITPPPVNATPPAVSGTMRLGQTLTSTAGTWSNTDTITYQWYRVGSPDTAIVGATASTHTVVAADLYAEVYCAVTATGDGGSTTLHTASLSSPLKAIWDIDADAAVWVRTAGWTASVGAAESEWSTADGRWAWEQASGSLQPTRSTTGLALDGSVTWMQCDTLASRCEGAHTMVIGWELTTDASTSARSIWCAASDDAGGSTYHITLNLSRPDAINTTRMSARWADSSLVSVSLTSLASKGSGPYLLAQVSGAQGSAARVESLDTPLVEVGSVTRPAGSATYEWLTLGARRLGASPTVSQSWLGTVHCAVLLTLAASDAQLEIVRAALAAEDAL